MTATGRDVGGKDDVGSHLDTFPGKFWCHGFGEVSSCCHAEGRGC